MSREEAASVYIDVMLGFRCEYRKYQYVVEVLTDNDKSVLQRTIAAPPGTVE